MFATFDRFEIKLTRAQAATGYHSGACDEDIADLLKEPAIARQFRRIDPAAIRAELREYGAWSDEELGDETQNRARILWIAAGNIVEGV